MHPETLHFRLERHDDEDGIYYVVDGIEIALVTDGQTIEQALHNLREAVALYYKGENGYVPLLPHLEVSIEVTEIYA